MDPLFKVRTLNKTPNPNTVVWYAMHQDYSENFVAFEKPPEEKEAGQICVKRLLAGGRGHMGPYEHPQITFNVGWFPHSVMQQARTHRVGCTFDVQSMRYTGTRICKAATEELPIEEVFYLRPVGYYSDRQGKKYLYSEHQRNKDLALCKEAAKRYHDLILDGFAEEHARGILPFDYRQHFVLSLNARSLMHILDLRSKLDAQDEIRYMCKLLFTELENWMPELAEWYYANRYGKARLAP